MKPPDRERNRESRASGTGGVLDLGARSDPPTENSWIHHMRHGNFAAAWEVADSILRSRAGKPCFHLPRHEQYVWTGEPLDGRRVLVRCYHGLGDTVQFIRYAALLKRVASEVIVWAQPELLPLLRGTEGIDVLLPLHDGAPDIRYDTDVELMELPHVFRTTVDRIDARVPYVNIHDATMACERRCRTRGSNRPLDVGLVWRSGSWDDRRSIPTAMLAPLAGLKGVRLHVLQQGSAVAEWPERWGPIAATPDLTKLARSMCDLDLMISVDSLPAHLAGALAVRVWTLLHSEPDWRWMLERVDSPWYPTMRLFRQQRAGDWASVIAEVTGELAMYDRQFAGPLS